MTPPDITFLGLPNAEIDNADVAIVSAAFEGTVSYGTGTSRGPSSILRASTQLETFDEEVGWDLTGLRVATLPAVEADPAERPEAYLTRLRKTCAGFGLAPPFPLGLGGEHSVTPAILAGLRKDVSDVTVVQIDAHADLRSEYHGTIHSHACAMRRLLDMGVRRLVAIGIRSCTQEEFELSRDDERITTFYAHQLQEAEVWDEVEDLIAAVEGPTYLTVDIDGLDVTFCPGTGTPQPGGLSWFETLRVVRGLIAAPDADVFAADITETVPQEGSQVNELVAARLAMKILGYKFAPQDDGQVAS